MKKVFALLLALVLLLSMSACGSDAKTPTAATENALTSLQKGSLANFTQYLVDGSAGSAQNIEKFLPFILSNLSFETTSTVIDGEKAIVTVSISNKDIPIAISQFTAGVLSQTYEYSQLPADAHPTSKEWDQIYADLLQKIFASTGVPTTTTDMEVTLVKQGKTWKIQGTEDFLTDILGATTVSSFEKLKTQRIEAIPVSPESEQEQTTEPVVEEEKGPAVLLGNGSLGDYFITIKTAEVVQDSDGSNVVLVTFDWVNNSGKNQTPAYCINIDVSQGGINLKSVYLGSDEKSTDNYWKKAKAGATVEIQKAFALADQALPVDVEIEEAFSLDNKIVVCKQFPIKIN